MNKHSRHIPSKSFPTKDDVRNSIVIASFIFIILTPITAALMSCTFTAVMILPLSLVISLCLPTITFLWFRRERKSVKQELSDEIIIQQLKESISLEISPNFFGIQGVIKRFFDLTIAIIALILLSPLFLIIALGIKIESPGPVFFSQERLGRNRKKIRIHKFRSMKVNAEELSDRVPVWAEAADDRITRVGGFLRKSYIDELPKLYNILNGDLSFIGPVPRLHYWWKNWEKTQNIPNIILSIQPGLFSIANVTSRIRGKELTQLHEWLLEVNYVNNWSLIVDIKIAWCLLKSLLFGSSEPPNINELGKRRQTRKQRLVTRTTPT